MRRARLESRNIGIRHYGLVWECEVKAPEELLRKLRVFLT